MMRIYGTILGLALVALALTIVAGSRLLPGYMETEGFWQSILVETLSFIASTAVIGSLSAAVLRYLDNRRTKPVLEFASSKLDEAFGAWTQAYTGYLRNGFGTNYSQFIAVGNGELPRHQSAFMIQVRNDLDRLVNAATDCETLISRYASYFPIERQDELSKLLSDIEEFRRDKEIERGEFPDLLDENAHYIPDRLFEVEQGFFVDLSVKLESLIGAHLKQDRKPISRRYHWPVLLGPISAQAFSISDENAVRAGIDYGRLWKANYGFESNTREAVATDEEAKLMARLPSGSFDLPDGIHHVDNVKKTLSPDELQALRPHLNPWTDSYERENLGDRKWISATALEIERLSAVKKAPRRKRKASSEG